MNPKPKQTINKQSPLPPGAIVPWSRHAPL
ncbi:hypothetical protein QFZ51_005988 [Chitinophaga sp. W3I9]